MKSPVWLKEQIAVEGRRAQERVITPDEATERITKQILDKDEGLVRSIVYEYVGKKLRDWTTKYSRALYEDSAPGQLDMFPELPRHVEVSPGRFADQAVMTARDWDNGLRQAQTKANNAGGYLQRYQEAYDKVRPLLTNDDLTTSDVWVAGWTGEAADGG